MSQRHSASPHHSWAALPASSLQRDSPIPASRATIFSRNLPPSASLFALLPHRTIPHSLQFPQMRPDTTALTESPFPWRTTPTSINLESSHWRRSQFQLSFKTACQRHKPFLHLTNTPAIRRAACFMAHPYIDGFNQLLAVNSFLPRPSPRNFSAHRALYMDFASMPSQPQSRPVPSIAFSRNLHHDLSPLRLTQRTHSASLQPPKFPHLRHEHIFHALSSPSNLVQSSHVKSHSPATPLNALHMLPQQPLYRTLPPHRPAPFFPQHSDPQPALPPSRPQSKLLSQLNSKTPPPTFRSPNSQQNLPPSRPHSAKR